MRIDIVSNYLHDDVSVHKKDCIKILTFFGCNDQHFKDFHWKWKRISLLLGGEEEMKGSEEIECRMCVKTTLKKLAQGHCLGGTR